ncbi:hypothetical protein HDU79_000099 [Rhizoclosmatium sp. JEL0117]|nr:hypothetical protein HDU79_000099 [Rhizoclosmatium sp. JEL0117]
MQPTSDALEFTDECCYCCYESDCCEPVLECCDDPMCEVQGQVHVQVEPPLRRTKTGTGSGSANSVLQALLFFGVAVSSVSAVAAGASDDNLVTGNSTADACAQAEASAYNEPFHIGGIFIVLLVSGLGIFGTLALGVRTKTPFFAKVLQIFKMFGIGIICSTAWIHLLPDAFSKFSSPCLPTNWQDYGPNYVGVFGMFSAFAVQLIELLAVDFKRKKLARENPDLEHTVVTGNSSAFLEHPSKEEMTLEQAIPSAHSGKNDNHDHTGVERDSELGTILLEAGIIFHSLIIGITLGVTGDDVFTSLLISVCFHQMFEGMALGVLIGNLQLSIWTKRLLCLAYPLTTPIGIGIGIAIRSFYNENDGGLILAEGIFNSLSAGILFYNTYTELMSAEVSHSGPFNRFTAGFKAACFLSMYLGASAMAIIGIWA